MNTGGDWVVGAVIRASISRGGETMYFKTAGCIATIFALLLVPTAKAATVKSVVGVVLVSTGGAYQRVQGSVQLEPGASVLANPGGHGQVVYNDNCVVDVRPGTVVWIENPPPCQGSPQAQSTTTGAESAAATAAAGGGLGTAGTLAIVGGVAVLGGALALGGGGDKNDKRPPASP